MLEQKLSSELYRRGFACHDNVTERGRTTYYMTRKGLDWLEKVLQIKIYNEEE